MKLFLAAEAKHPDSIEKLKEFVGKDFSNLKLVYIPTAANGEVYGCWKNGESIRAAQSLEANIRVVELEDVNYRDVLAEIKGADILWMAGGMVGYLSYWIQRTKLNELIPDMLSAGTIYVGSSAGSMICAKTLSVAEWFIGEPEPGASLLPGLGLVDFEIYPHFEDELLPEIKKNWKGNTLHLLKNGEVITVVNGKVEVLGKERILE
jgi:dipeptidase E